MMRSNIAMAIVASVPMISVVTISEVQAVESDAYYAYENQLRKQILESWTRSDWKSSCFIAENGLRSLIEVNFSNQDEEYWLTAKKKYFFDTNCNKYADMEENLYKKVGSTNYNVTFFYYMEDDHLNTIEYKSDGFFIKFGTQVIQLFTDNPNA